MGSGALNWFPGYIAQAGHDVQIVECLHAKVTEEVVGNPPFKVDVHLIQSDNIYDHLDKIFNVARKFCPDVLYVFGRRDLYEYVYHLRHRYPKIRIIVDIRSPSLAARPEDVKSIEDNFNNIQYYVDHINAHELESLKTYTKNIFKPVTIVPIGVHCAGIKIKPRPDKPLLLRKFVFVGSIFRRRRIDILVDNFIRFAQSVEAGVSLDIYGSGDSVRQIEEFISNKSAQQYVKMKGSLPQEELFNSLSGYDAGIAYVPYELYSTAPS